MQFSAITSTPPFSPRGVAGTQNKSDNTQPTAESQTSTNGSHQPGSHELTDADRRQIAQLQKIDREVRAHEAAHIAAAGGLARGGASFSYTQGPDGKRYAVSGEVSIDTSPVRDNPEATLLKAQRIQAAALAPAQPSSADRAIAASAASMAAMARAELLTDRLTPENSEAEKTELQKADSLDGNQPGDDKGPDSTDASGANKTQTQTKIELRQLIKQTTDTENRLGNLLDTAV